jgi:hypothetical protein
MSEHSILTVDDNHSFIQNNEQVILSILNPIFNFDDDISQYRIETPYRTNSFKIDPSFQYIYARESVTKKPLFTFSMYFSEFSNLWKINISSHDFNLFGQVSSTSSYTIDIVLSNTLAITDWKLKISNDRAIFGHAISFYRYSDKITATSFFDRGSNDDYKKEVHVTITHNPDVYEFLKELKPLVQLFETDVNIFKLCSLSEVQQALKDRILLNNLRLLSDMVTV